MTARGGRRAFSTLAAMPGRRLVSLLAAGACVALAGCGDDGSGGEIPPDTATAMQQSLQRIEDAQAAEDCETAEDATGDLISRVEALGDDVDEQIRDSLAAGADQLNALVDRQVCEPVGTTDEEAATEAAPLETAETAPTTTETTEETTTTTEPEEEGEDGEGEDGGGELPPESELPPEGEEGANAPPGPEGNPSQPAPGGGVEVEGD
jgi:hypothetical protein